MVRRGQKWPRLTIPIEKTIELVSSAPANQTFGGGLMSGTD
jgi:hypothetical protein